MNNVFDTGYFNKFRYQILVNGQWRDVPDEVYVRADQAEKAPDGADVLEFKDGSWRTKPRRCKIKPR